MSDQGPPTLTGAAVIPGSIGVAIAIPEPYGSQLQSMRASFGDSLAEAIPTHVTLLPPTIVDPHALDGIVDPPRKAIRACSQASVAPMIAWEALSFATPRLAR